MNPHAPASECIDRPGHVDGVAAKAVHFRRDQHIAPFQPVEQP
jgi:hypothetical protein